METVSIWIFLPLTLCCMAAAFHPELRRRVLALRPVAALESRLRFDSHLYVPAFVCIMLAGVLVRCVYFGVYPLGLNQDGTMAGVEAYCLLRDGTDEYGISLPTYFTAWKFSQMSTLYSYLLIPFVKLMGLTRYALRLPMLLVSVAMLPLIWDFARRIVGKGYALLVLLVAAHNPWQIMQSRWALEANLMPHVLLLAVYLLCIGREKRWALYLSMVCFALTLYAYGVACFVTPFLLLASAIFLLARKKVRVRDVVLCVMVFLLVAGPYLMTMAINAFGLETMHLGSITMPYFEDSLREQDIALTQKVQDPYLVMLRSFHDYLDTFLFNFSSESYNALHWTGSMYRFMPPVFLAGLYLMWKDRRRLALARREEPMREGAMLILLWMGMTVINGMQVGGVINRNNVVFYPLILLAGYGLYAMGRRLRTALALVLTLMIVSFSGFCANYFSDEVQQEIGVGFHYGLQEALADTWDWDYDKYYLSDHNRGDAVQFMDSQVMFAHQIDYRARSEQTDLIGPNGEHTDWYFQERYQIVNFSDGTEFVPDPMECAVYIVREHETNLFNPDDFIITPYGHYAAVYPRYWAE